MSETLLSLWLGAHFGKFPRPVLLPPGCLCLDLDIKSKSCQESFTRQEGLNIGKEDGVKRAQNGAKLDARHVF